MTAPSRFAPSPPGRVGRVLIRLLMKHASVVQSQPLGEGFHRLTLEGPALKDVAWSPGQKIQIPIGSAFVTRTYTPIDWDGAAGRVRLLGYAHGVGPGSDWVRNVAPGDECDLFGPRASLDLTRLNGPIALFGDETSFGVACAGADEGQLTAAQCLFEVNHVDIARSVAEQIGLGAAMLSARQPEEAHLRAVERALTDLAEAGASFVLTGKASSVQRLRQTLKASGVAPARIMTKAYWAPGKAGLD